MASKKSRVKQMGLEESQAFRLAYSPSGSTQDACDFPSGTGGHL